GQNFRISATAGALQLMGTNVYFGTSSADPGVRLYSDAVRWQYNVSNYIRQRESGHVEFVMGNTVRHAFDPTGRKIGGSIEIDDRILGMSPVDSPQILLETVLFDVELKKDHPNVIWIDEDFSKAVTKYSVFPNVD